MAGVEVLDDHTIDKLAEGLGATWHELAEQLGFDEVDCANITEVLPSDERAHHMLTALRERCSGLVRMDDLRSALEKIGRYDLLKETGKILKTQNLFT